MKKKKYAAFILMLLMIISCFSNTVYAAPGDEVYIPEDNPDYTPLFTELLGDYATEVTDPQILEFTLNLDDYETDLKKVTSDAAL